MKRHTLPCICLTLTLVCSPQWVAAQDTPGLDAQQLIERLENPPVTRGLRNLKPVQRSVDLVVQFDFDSDRLQPSSLDQLKQLAQAMLSDRLLQSRFLIQGHTDAKGNVTYNLKLSEKRALAVSRFLQSQGVGSERLAAAGKGASDLANTVDPYAAENRRVRIINQGE
jgi:outer membrane protein OmpA-like peptidoglycan-associated protein